MTVPGKGVFCTPRMRAADGRIVNCANIVVKPVSTTHVAEAGGGVGYAAHVRVVATGQFARNEKAILDRAALTPQDLFQGNNVRLGKLGAVGNVRVDEKVVGQHQDRVHLDDAREFPQGSAFAEHAPLPIHTRTRAGIDNL